MSTTLGTRLCLLTPLEASKDFLRRLGCEILIKVIADNHHWCVTASTLAFHLNDSELSVLCRLTGFDVSDLFTDRVEDVVRASQHAGGRSADLHKVLTDRFPIEHGVESGNLVNAHGRHTQEFCDVVHYADTCPSFVLPLSEIEEGNDGGFLVLRRVFGDDFLSAF